MVKFRQNSSKEQWFSYKGKTEGKVLPPKPSIYPLSIHLHFLFFPITLTLSSFLLPSIPLLTFFSMSAASIFTHRALWISKSKVSANTTTNATVPCYSRCSSWMICLVTALKLVRMQNLRSHPRHMEPDLHFNRTPKWFLGTLKCEKHWYSQ